MSYAFFEQKYPLSHEIPVKIINPSNYKSTTVKMVVDSASWSQVDSKYRNDLGLGTPYHYFDRNGIKFGLYRLLIQVGNNTRPTQADIYFGSKELTHTNVKKAETDVGALGWANNGGMANYIIDMDERNLKFTDYSYIHSLPNPVNNYTIVKLEQPRLDPRWKEEILYNQPPYHYITCWKNNNKSRIRVLVDTGAAFTLFEDKYAEILGVDIKKGKKVKLPGLVSSLTFYRHDIWIQIGNLKPRLISIGFGDFPHTILGVDTLFRYRTRFMKDKIMYEENHLSIFNKV